MEGCHNDIISAPESPEMCADGGVLEHQELMVHQTYPTFIHSRSRTTFGYNWSGDRPTHYTSRSSSRRAFQSDSRSIVEDSRVVDQPGQQSTKFDI